MVSPPVTVSGLHAARCRTPERPGWAMEAVKSHQQPRGYRRPEPREGMDLTFRGTYRATRRINARIAWVSPNRQSKRDFVAVNRMVFFLLYLLPHSARVPLIAERRYNACRRTVRGLCCKMGGRLGE